MSADGNSPSPTTLSSIIEATMISRSASVLTSEVNGDVFMINIQGGLYFSLDDIGSDIWRRLDLPCSFGTLVSILASEYEADKLTIAADVRRLLARMAESGLVNLA
jgi:hypothetical protein